MTPAPPKYSFKCEENLIYIAKIDIFHINLWLIRQFQSFFEMCKDTQNKKNVPEIKNFG